MQEEIRNLKKERNGRNYYYELYLAGNGISPKDRKFPSIETRNKIVCGTLSLAKYYAKLYYYKGEKNIPYDDLYQVACESLMSAAHYYIPNNNAKFTTYASRCIENKLKRLVCDDKKNNKKTYKLKDFFEQEKKNMRYVKMFIDAHKYIDDNGEEYHTLQEEIIENWTLRRFRRSIKDYNETCHLQGKVKDKMISYKGKETEEKYHFILKKIFLILKNSKIKILMTDDEKYFIRALILHKNIPKELSKISELDYCVNTYLYKLNMIEKYLNFEKELKFKNNSQPSDEEILKIFNDEIKNMNKMIYRFKKGYKPSYKRLHNFYSIYLNEYDFDPFDIDEFDRKSKEEEKNAIALKFDEIIEDLEDTIEMCNQPDKLINWMNCEKVIFYYDEKVSEHYSYIEPYNKNDETHILSDTFNKYNTRYNRIMNKQEFIDMINDYIKNYNDNKDEYIKQVLKERKDYVNAILKEKNAPLIEYNKKIALEMELYKKRKKYERYLTLKDIEIIKKDIKLLFESGEEIYSYLNQERNKSKFHNSNILLEEEILNDCFMEDYYKCLNSLDPLERNVLLSYFDSNGMSNRTTKEISEEFDIKEKEVYKVKVKALNKLRNNEIIQNYLEEKC